MPAGSLVLTFYGAANRDPAKFTNPNEFDLNRTEKRHLAFGYGPHTCMGSQLAIQMGTRCFEAILNEFSELELLEPENRLPRSPVHYFRMPHRLPVRFR